MASSVIAFDLPIMIAVALAALPVLFTGHVIARWEGAVFLGYYVAYTSWLILAAQEHDALGAFSRVMTGFVTPIVVLTVVVLVVREMRGEAGK